MFGLKEPKAKENWLKEFKTYFEQISESDTVNFRLIDGFKADHVSNNLFSGGSIEINVVEEHR